MTDTPETPMPNPEDNETALGDATPSRPTTPTLQPAFIPVRDEVWTCVADADTRAVLAAKTSRAAHLQWRWSKMVNETQAYPWGSPSEETERFLDRNVRDYSHASVAEGAESFSYVTRLGWPMTWLVEDFPLFRGQEVSTRAVDVLGEEPCRYAPAEALALHSAWAEVFEGLKHGAYGGGYKFDEIRWALPGTTPAGVTCLSEVRNIVRHLESVESLGDKYAALASDFYAALNVYAPTTTAAIRRGPRGVARRWNSEPVRLSTESYDLIQDKALMVRVEAHTPGRRQRISHVRRARSGTRVCESVKDAGLFDVEIFCSVAAARDWHRHRSVMPWKLNVLTWPPSVTRAPSGKVVRSRDIDSLVVSPFYPDAHGAEFSTLWARTSKAYDDVQRVAPWSALFCVPFGAMVRVSCSGTLDNLIYMFELRYSASGANFEYKEQARQGLLALAASVGDALTERLDILGCLPLRDRERFYRTRGGPTREL